jgi:hypothetical protein
MSTRQRRRRDDRRRTHSTAGSTKRRLLLAGGLTAGSALAMPVAAHASPMTFTVGSTADTSAVSDCTTPTNIDCTLRQAIDLANANTPDADAIVFRTGLSGAIDIHSLLPTITEGLAIQGPGPGTMSVDGTTFYPVIFQINTATTDPVSISGLTITHGYTTSSSGGAIRNSNSDLTLTNDVVSDSHAVRTSSYGEGGGIYSEFGSLTIDSSTVSGNSAYSGGGIASYYSPTTITHSTVTGNTAVGQGSGPPNYQDAYGGGIWSEGSDLTIDGSTIDGNMARDGGAVYSQEGVGGIGYAMTIRNSTVADNHVHDEGGGIWDDGTNSSLAVIGSTVTGNTALTDAGGIKASPGTDPVLKDSIVSGNTANPASTDDLKANASYPFDTYFSLIGMPSGYVYTEVPNSNLFGVDPQLGPLQNNGGPTQTELPANSSPVIDRGKAFGLTADQRGLTRPVDIPTIANSTATGADGADMGAVEVQSIPTGGGGPPAVGGSPPPGPTGQRGAALKKCKKKHSKKARRKCRKRAKRLPL